ncbi:MAG: cupin domain-containing protein [Flavobacteriaceae bacterium]|nr:cupin domain-containing protein [Flavobacteriaceae bacterium]
MSKYYIQKSPTTIPTEDGKTILEHFGHASINNPKLSIAHMKAPPGWGEPAQTPIFDEYTFIIRGKKQIVIGDETIILSSGQSIKVDKGTRVEYSNPFLEECEYLAICNPAFSIDAANRE